MSGPKPTIFDLASLSLDMGDSHTFGLDLYLPPIHLAGQDYRFVPDVVPAQLMLTFVGQGFTALLSFSCRLEGACWRCLEPANLDLEVAAEDFFETSLPPEDERTEADEPSLWFLENGTLNLSEWAHSAVAERLPVQILCGPECQGLCPQCGANLNLTACGCQPPVDTRWDKLKELKEKLQGE